MKICSYLTDSFTEYEGEYSLVVFTKECNLNCFGCYNKNIMTENNLSFKKVLKETLTPLHTAIVFLGGEPTMNTNLIPMLLYTVGNYPALKIKVFTNGMHYLKVLEAEPLVDSFSVDFKTWENTGNLLGTVHTGEEYRNALIHSLDYLYKQQKLHEIRTVISPKLTQIELERIKNFVSEKYPHAQHIISKFIYTAKNS